MPANAQPLTRQQQEKLTRELPHLEVTAHAPAARPVQTPPESPQKRSRPPRSGQSTVRLLNISKEAMSFHSWLYDPTIGDGPGRYRAEFGASELPRGVYFYRLEAGSFVRTRAMTLLK